MGPGSTVPAHVPTAMAAVTAAVQPKVHRPECHRAEPEMPVSGVPTDVPTAVGDAPPAKVTATVPPHMTEPAEPVRDRRRSEPSAHHGRSRGNKRSPDQDRRC
jgi:hypothetical protein